jgi:hypothetical protein
MDGPRFDRLTRGLTSAGWTRRGLAATLAGGVLSLLGGAAPGTDAKKGKGKKKKRKCRNGAIKCGKGCVNPQTDALHCGGCDRRCGDNSACVNGSCQGGGGGGGGGGGCNQPCNGDLTCIQGECKCATGTKCGTECCVGNEVCDTDHCIPDPDDLACTSQADCGAIIFINDLRCNLISGRCECNFAGQGLCERLSDGGGKCDRCCPGSGREVGDKCLRPVDDFICVDQTEAGCRCPDGRPITCESVDDRGTKCTADRDSDPLACGVDCSKCAPGRACCDGHCTASCPPGSSSSDCFQRPCGGSCVPCSEDAPLCCDLGGGPRCVEPIGGHCPTEEP